MVLKGNQHSKERFFDLFKKVNYINESKLSPEKKMKILNDFVNFVGNKLDIMDNLPNIKISNDDFAAKKMKSFGKYTPDLKEIVVVMVNRNLADVLRTLAHEIVHHKQNLENKLDVNSNDDGSDIENEANALAAVFMRVYGKNNPIIFE